jgi:hypothetical protein
MTQQQKDYLDDLLSKYPAFVKGNVTLTINPYYLTEIIIELFDPGYEKRPSSDSTTCLVILKDAMDAYQKWLAEGRKVGDPPPPPVDRSRIDRYKGFVPSVNPSPKKYY